MKVGTYKVHSFFSLAPPPPHHPVLYLWSGHQLQGGGWGARIQDGGGGASKVLPPQKGIRMLVLPRVLEVLTILECVCVCVDGGWGTKGFHPLKRGA